MASFHKRLVIVSLGVFLFLIAGSAQAGVNLVTDRTALGGTDYIDWGVLGPTFTVISNPFSINSQGGVPVTVSMLSTNDFQRRDCPTGFNANFGNGDKLLWTNTYANFENPTTLMTFGGNGIMAGGAQILADTIGGFVAKIEAYDEADNSLGSFTRAGVTIPANANNSAIFMGVETDDEPIFKVAFTILQAGTNISSFAINQFDFIPPPPPPTVIPEPSTVVIWSVLGAVAVGFGWWRRRRSR